MPSSNRPSRARIPGRSESKPAAHIDADTRVMDALRRLVRVLSTSARESSRRSGVTGAQLFVMRQISAVPGCSVRDLVGRTLSRQSTVSEVIARLVTRGLVARRAGIRDARQAELTLTARGERIIADAGATVQERLAHALTTLPVADRASLAGSFERWIAAAGLEDIPATMFFEKGARPRPSAQDVGRNAAVSR